MYFRTLFAGMALLSASAAFAQTIQQRQDPFATQPPQGLQAPVTPAQTIPIPQIPAVQTPTIINQVPAAVQQQMFLQQRALQAPSQQLQQPQQALQQPGAGAADAADQNEFQQFIAASTGKPLRVFGSNLFDSPSTFAPVDNVPVTANYVVGPGDELLIRAWGQIDIDYRALVDRDGMINIPRVGSVPVAGVKYQDLTAHLRTVISRNFRNFQLLVTMGQLRSIQIFVVGQARRPGAYTVSSLSTLVNAIFAVGGPNGDGSMRAIQLKRGNSVVTEFDLYDLLLVGDKSKDVQLLPGDVIYFPSTGALAAVSGSVKNAAIFELKGPTNVGALLDFAGGLTTTAQARRVTLERIDERKTRTVDQFALDYDGLRRNVKDGDLVSVLAISPRFENAVTLRGNVIEALRFPHRPGMRVRDLIPDKQTLLTQEYFRRQNMATRPSLARPEGTRADATTQQGAPQGASQITQGRLSADVRRITEEINWDYAVIERLNPADLSTSLIPFNLGKAILDNDPSQNIPLAPGDVVTVFSKTDVGAPAGRRPVVVSLEGEFNHAGVYQALPGENLRQLITRVGGVTDTAYIFGAEFTRESTRRNQEERLRQAVDEVEQDVQRAAVTRAQSVISPEDASALKQEAEAQRALVTRLRTLKPSGRVVLELAQEATIASLPEIPLEDGDRLRIPQRPSMVSVFGTVFNETSFLYSPDKSVADYLDQAGGPRKEADKKSIYVLRADGSVVSSRQSGILVGSLASLRVSPGDTIIVPENFERTTWVKDLRDWTQIFYQFGLGAAAIKVLQN